MKSAYELALERMEKQGIERPREDALSEEKRQEIAELKSRAEARLAELEILYQDRRKKGDAESEQEYRRERQRIEDDLERKIERLRGGD